MTSISHFLWALPISCGLPWQKVFSAQLLLVFVKRPQWSVKPTPWMRWQGLLMRWQPGKARYLCSLVELHHLRRVRNSLTWNALTCAHLCLPCKTLPKSLLLLLPLTLPALFRYLPSDKLQIFLKGWLGIFSGSEPKACSACLPEGAWGSYCGSATLEAIMWVTHSLTICACPKA